jgi:DNA repair exonuclease SbcCD nuclease subunit
VGGTVVATVSGLSYDRREVTENLALRFPRAAGRDSDAGFRVGLLHCSVGDQPEHSAYSPCSLADLSAAAVDYWALGHIHRAAVLKEGHPWVVYPGNTQGRSPKPAEMGAKGAMLIEVDGGEVRSAEFLPTDAVRFTTLTVGLSDLPEGTDLAGLRTELVRRAVDLLGPQSDRALLVRAELTGRGSLHNDLVLAGAAEELLRDMRDALAGATPPVWFESLRDRTAPEIDLDTVRARDDFTANVLARADALMVDDHALEHIRASLTPAVPAELLRRCSPPDDAGLRRLLDAAAVLAVEALESEASTCG